MYRSNVENNLMDFCKFGDRVGKFTVKAFAEHVNNELEVAGHYENNDKSKMITLSMPFLSSKHRF